MPTHPRNFASVLLVAAALSVSGPAWGKETRTEALAAEALAAGVRLGGTIAGHDSVRYELSAGAGQVLSADLSPPDSSLQFTIRAKGADEALFSNKTADPVADVPLPADGTYVIEVFHIRASARRNETADYDLAVSLNGADFADGLAGGPGCAMPWPPRWTAAMWRCGR